jgi:uncharacterized protein (TIGR02466 family)
MPQYQIHKLFPTPLFVHDDITTTEKQRDFVYAQKWYRPEADNGWLTKNLYLLDEPVMKPLKDKIMDAFDIFLHDVMQIPEDMKCRMTNSWGVKHNSGDWGQQHIHTNSVFSGVYYMDTNEQTGNISFHRHVSDISVLPLTARPGKFNELNEFNALEHKVQSSVNRLVFFPSSLMHSVSRNNSEWDRYSIAFNFFPIGTWGFDEHELKL